MRNITVTPQPARERFIVEGLNFHGFLPNDAEVSIVNGVRHLHFVEVIANGVTAKIHLDFADIATSLRQSLFKYDENTLVSMLYACESKIVNGYMAVLREVNARSDQEEVRAAEAESLAKDPDLHFMRKVGHGFYGERWQAPLARDLGWPQSYMASIVSGTRTLSDERRSEWRKNGVRLLRYRAEDILIALDDAARVGTFEVPTVPPGGDIECSGEKA